MRFYISLPWKEKRWGCFVRKLRPMRGVDCIHSPFSRRHINVLLYICFELLYGENLNFLSAAFSGSFLWHVVCFFWAWLLACAAAELCSATQGAALHLQGALPLDPILSVSLSSHSHLHQFMPLGFVNFYNKKCSVPWQICGNMVKFNVEHFMYREIYNRKLCPPPLMAVHAIEWHGFHISIQ